MARSDDIQFEPVGVAGAGRGRERSGRLAVVAPVVGLALVVAVAVAGRPASGPELVAHAPEVAATVTLPTATATLPAATTRRPLARAPARLPRWAGDTRPAVGEDGLMGGITFGTAWSWLTDPEPTD